MKFMAIPLLSAVLAWFPNAAEPGSDTGQNVKLTFHDGTVRTATLQGVGCPMTICSRIAVQGATDDHTILRQGFHDLAAIRDITRHDALFVEKNGDSRRLTLLYDFRVLYLGDEPGKVDLATVKSVEFTGAAR